jgi:hypothetical protein
VHVFFSFSEFQYQNRVVFEKEHLGNIPRLAPIFSMAQYPMIGVWPFISTCWVARVLFLVQWRVAACIPGIPGTVGVYSGKNTKMRETPDIFSPLMGRQLFIGYSFNINK